jgi:hypothetical protein
MGNSPSFPTITHTTLSSKRFRCYGILMINAAAEFYSGQNSGRTDLQFSVSDWLKLWKSQILFQTTTLSAFWWSIKWLQMVSNLWVTAVRNSTGHRVSISGRSYLPVSNRFLMNFCYDLPRNFLYKKRCERTQLSAGYSYDSFRHTVWSLRIFEAKLQCRTDSRQTDVVMEFSGLGA